MPRYTLATMIFSQNVGLSATATALSIAVVCCVPSVDHGPTVGFGGWRNTAAGGGGSGDAPVILTTAPPSADAEGLCGNQIHNVASNPPNVYFVLDVSGSMATATGSGSRYAVVQSAVARQVQKLSGLIKAGAAVFPSAATDLNPCQPGRSIVEPALGNASAFDSATRGIAPFGGTPTSATLAALKPVLLGLSGKTVVVLATDGAPNCNPAAVCSIDECTWNVEGCPTGMSCCSQGQDCCLPGTPAPSSGGMDCIDRAATVNAVSDLNMAGIRVHIIGIPGSLLYSRVLADMAIAGGALVSPFYYAVDDLSTLGSVLGGIAGGALSCDITVDDPPDSQGFTNVYLDQNIVLSDPDSGWTWTSSSVVTLHGAACASLKSGTVSQVQVVSGCPTEVPR